VFSGQDNYISEVTYKPGKSGHRVTEYFCDQSSSKFTQDYRSLSVAVMVCDALVNTQTHTKRQTEKQTAFDRLLE